MLTLFSVQRAFRGATGIIQNNALGSWARLGASCEVILFGDEPGVAEAAARHGVRHYSNVARNEYGTPLLDDIFAKASQISQRPLLCMLNADIILVDDFLPAVERAISRLSPSLMISSRFNFPLEHELSFEPGWDRALRLAARAAGRMYPAGGSDIFVFTRGLFQAVPPFAIGRGFWDNWLIRESGVRGAPVIDATSTVTAIHQDHDYGHVPGVPADSRDDRHVYTTEEGHRNLLLAGGRRRLHTVLDASHVLTPEGRLLSTLRPSLLPRRIKAGIRRAVALG